MELSRTRITGTPFSFSRWCLWRGMLSRVVRCGCGCVLLASGYFRHWAGDGRHERSRRQIQDETEETGACKNLYHLILDSKTHNGCGAGGRAGTGSGSEAQARRGMGWGSLSTLS